MNTIPRREAIEKGMICLTTPYLKRQQWMLENVIADMERGNINYAIVDSPMGGKEVWRAAQGL